MDDEKYEVQDLVEYHFTHFCPKCSVKNWTYHSHSQRSYTGSMNDNACKCHSCGLVYWLEVDLGNDFLVVQAGRPTPDE